MYVEVPVEVLPEKVEFPYYDLRPTLDINKLLPVSETSDVVQNSLMLVDHILYLEAYLRLIQGFYEGADISEELKELQIE